MSDLLVSGKASAATPVVSLIVPMYNVREYLDECLESILAQDLAPIQVILVDDGSTDGTAQIAQGYADAYPQVEYHLIPNQGLGHARNYGARFARGSWLMFPDSDDRLAPHALRDMVALGERHGCDLVTGDVTRFSSAREWPNSLHRTAFRGVPELCHITKHPSLLYDHTAWNKLFKREFFERAGLQWVEGHLYEDMPCSTPAHVLASRVAYLDKVVYQWRERDGAVPSITQRRTEIANFRDRMHAITLVDQFFAGYDVPDTLRLAKDAKWLTLDIPIYLDVLPEATDEYRHEVVDAVADYLEGIDSRAWALAPSAERIKCRLALRRDVQGLVDFVRWCREAGDTLRVVRKGGRLYGSYPVKGLTAIDRDMTDELARTGLYSDVKSVALDGAAMAIDASVLVPRLSQRRTALVARLVNRSGGRVLPLEVTPHPSRRAVEVRANKAHRSTAIRWQPLRDFTLTVPTAALGSLVPGAYRVSLAYADDDFTCEETQLAGPVAGEGPRPRPVRVGAHVLAVTYGPGGELTLVVREDRNLVARVSLRGGELHLEREDGTRERIELDDVPYAKDARLVIHHLDKGNDELWLVAATQAGTLGLWRMGPSVAVRSCAVHGAKLMVQLVWPYPDEPSQCAKAWLVGDEFGSKVLLSLEPSEDEHGWSASIDLADQTVAGMLRDDSYHLIVELAGQTTSYEAVMAVVGDSEDETRDAHEVLSGADTARTPQVASEATPPTSVIDSSNDERDACEARSGADAAHAPQAAAEATPPTSVIDSSNDERDACEARSGADAARTPQAPIEATPPTIAAADTLPTATTYVIHENGFTYELDLRGHKPLLTVRHDRTWDEGRLRQMAIERVAYPLMRRLPLQKNLVLFESFWATSVGCSPKALYDFIDANHPELQCVWSVRDTRMPVGGRAQVVRQGSYGYYVALARAKYLVNNVNFPDYYVKRPGQVEVQTMHGTPLKTMGIDVRDEVPNDEVAQRFLRTCSRWDYLVVQSRRVEQITARCFGFAKTFLRTGYPRNDALLKRNTPEEQRRLKLRMGADPDKPLIVYAPTWRVRGRFDLQLDLAQLERSLGKRYEFALRRHYMAVPRMSGRELLSGTIDLTFGWSVDDVMLAADAIITDYSSIMFDFALLGRPMLFYVYDLEEYRDDLRGFNLDFEAEAPGPLLRTTEEVAQTLGDLVGMRMRYEDRYQAFVQSFLEYESDHSCEDVFQQVFVSTKG